MDVAELLAVIVERACLYVPKAPVGASNIKMPKEAFTETEKFPKEAFRKVVQNEELSVVKVPMVTSNLVRK